jgi:hypothetical protein
MGETKNCLLVGLKPVIVDDAKNEIAEKNVTVFTASSLQEVQDVFSHHIDIVIMGAGLELSDRLKIAKYIFETSNSTSVHMKDKDSGPDGFIPFIKKVLDGMTKE